MYPEKNQLVTNLFHLMVYYQTNVPGLKDQDVDLMSL